MRSAVFSVGIGFTLLLVSCAGAPANGKYSTETNSSERHNEPTESSGGPMAPLKQPKVPSSNCEDGTCFSCGKGFCPRGAYCEEDAQGGPACSWLKECKQEPSCDCIVDVIGDECRCTSEAGGPSLSCR